MTTALLCDDNPAIAMSLKGYLKQENISAISVSTAEEALDVFDNNEIDVAIIDIMLPGMNGLDLCREIKKRKEIPVIILSAKGEEIDRIIGLEVGADDYVTKPFSPHEVAIRCRKLIKRTGKEKEEEDIIVTVGSLTMFPASFEIRVNDKPVRLSSKEFKVLLYLAEHEERVMTRDQIINSVWGVEYDNEPRIVDTLVKRLRQKISAEAGNNLDFAIETVYGVGYKLKKVN